MQLLVAETISIPAFMARLSPLLIHQFATCTLADNVPFAPKSPTPALWRFIMVSWRSTSSLSHADLRFLKV